MKDENETTNVGCDTTGAMLNKNAETVSNVTTDVKNKWFRECSRCHKIRYYSSRKTYFTTLKRNTICKSCSNSINASGKSPSNATREKLSKAVSGNKNGHFGKTGTNLGKQFSHMHKLNISKAQKGRTWSDEFREKMSQIRDTPKYREACRLGAIKRMLKQRLNGNIYARSYNADACDYFNTLNREKGWALIHAGNGGETECHGYFLDAYDKTQNIVVEYDESRHYKVVDNNWILSPKDLTRMEEIKRYLGCEFYRYNEMTKTLSKY